MTSQVRAIPPGAADTAKVFGRPREADDLSAGPLRWEARGRPLADSAAPAGFHPRGLADHAKKATASRDAGRGNHSAPRVVDPWGTVRNTASSAKTIRNDRPSVLGACGP